MLQEIMRLQNMQAWDRVADRYHALRLNLARAETGARMPAEHRRKLKAAQNEFRMIVESIEDARIVDQPKGLDTGGFNRTLSDQAVIIEGIRIALMKPGS